MQTYFVFLPELSVSGEDTLITTVNAPLMVSIRPFCKICQVSKVVSADKYFLCPKISAVINLRGFIS